MSPTDCGPLQADLRPLLVEPGRRRPLIVRAEDGGHDLGGGMRTEGEVLFHGTGWTQMGTLYAEGTITASLVRRCRRCLQDVRCPVSLEEEFELEYGAEDDCVDLTPQILGAIAAVYDPLVLCDAECRGLCPRCGADLNIDPEHRCTARQDADTRRLGDLLR
jgi:uncharacterized protein